MKKVKMNVSQCVPCTYFLTFKKSKLCSCDLTNTSITLFILKSDSERQLRVQA